MFRLLQNNHHQAVYGKHKKETILNIVHGRDFGLKNVITYVNIPNVNIPKLIMKWIPGERRKRGRPRKKWMEGVRSAMKTRHLEANQWLNRKEWCLGSGRRQQLSQDRKDR